MRMHPHLTFRGECQAAFESYATCFGGEITFMMTYGASHMAATSPELADKVLHATLQIGDQRLTGADVPFHHYQKPQGFALQVNMDEAGEAERVFSALAESGIVILPPQATFWAERYGLVTDRFGTPWEINCGPRRT